MLVLCLLISWSADVLYNFVENMDKKTLQKFKKILEQKKKKLEIELASIAKKDPRQKGDYDSNYPNFGATQSSDEEALEVSAYESRLPVEYAMELKLRDINLALEKMKKGTYGKCENCPGQMDEKRLEAMPEARICLNCAQVKK